MTKKNEDGQSTHLNFQQKRQLQEYLRTHRERILKERPNYADLARECQEKLKFPVSYRLAKEIAGYSDIEWEPARAGGETGKKNANKRLDLLTERLDKLEARIISSLDGADRKYSNIQEQLQALNERLTRLESGLNTLENHWLETTSQSDDVHKSLRAQVDGLRGLVARLFWHLNITDPAVPPKPGQRDERVAGRVG